MTGQEENTGKNHSMASEGRSRRRRRLDEIPRGGRERALSGDVS